MDKFSEYIVSSNMLIQKALTDRTLKNIKPAMKEVDSNRNLATLGEQIYKCYISQTLYNRVANLNHVLLDYFNDEIIVKLLCKKYNLIEFIKVDSNAKLTKNYDYKVIQNSKYISTAFFALIGAIYLIKRIDAEEIIEGFVKEIDKYYRTHQQIKPSVERDYVDSRLYLYNNLDEFVNDEKKLKEEVELLKSSKPDYEYYQISKKRVTAKSEREKLYNSAVKKAKKEEAKTNVLEFNQKCFIQMANYSTSFDNITFTYYDIDLNVKGLFDPVDFIIDIDGKPYLTELCINPTLKDVISSILETYTNLKIVSRPNAQKIISDYANENYKASIILAENNPFEYEEILNNKLVKYLLEDLNVSVFVGKLQPAMLDTNVFNVKFDEVKKL